MKTVGVGPCGLTRRAVIVGAAALAAASPARPVSPREASEVQPMPCGSATRAGLDVAAGRGRVVRVRSLDDDGPGSLRAAVAEPGEHPIVVVFDVGGVVRLSRTLSIERPNVRVAGQTAPGLGIALEGAPLGVRASNVIVEHLRLRPGPAPTPKASEGQDGVFIRGRHAGVEDVILRNCSILWAVDEGVDTGPRWGDVNRRISLVDCLIAETLSDPPNAHEPRHNFPVFIRSGSFAVEIVGCLIAGGRIRTPRFISGSSGVVAGCYVHGFGDSGHNGPSPVTFAFPHEDALDPALGDRSIHLSVRGCAAEADRAMAESGGPSPHVISDAALLQDVTGGRWLAFFEDDNLIESLPAKPTPPRVHQRALTRPPTAGLRAWTAARETKRACLRHAGATPGRRDATDARIVAALAAVTPDTPYALRPALAPSKPPDDAPPPVVHDPPDVPADPFGMIEGDLTRVEAWLDTLHLAHGGRADQALPEDMSEFADAALDRPKGAAPIFGRDQLWRLTGGVGLDPTYGRRRIAVGARPLESGGGSHYEIATDWDGAWGVCAVELTFQTIGPTAIDLSAEGAPAEAHGWRFERVGALGAELLSGLPEPRAPESLEQNGSHVVAFAPPGGGGIAAWWRIPVEAGALYALNAEFKPTTRKWFSVDVRIVEDNPASNWGVHASAAYFGRARQRADRLWRAPVSGVVRVGFVTHNGRPAPGDSVSLSEWSFRRVL